ncbi:hypothetical protein D9Q98_008008 [Chlorella vulgaris]|uniref:Uncharacterized protein n=1 Tax=Chlorella vulgaris TaxID=3077 RepID=A0A9D4TI42_CHLVU|nr:hypothetical protein D9Q98_008008 [Chlorella vulgaris]
MHGAEAELVAPENGADQPVPPAVAVGHQPVPPAVAAADQPVPPAVAVDHQLAPPAIAAADQAAPPAIAAADQPAQVVEEVFTGSEEHSEDNIADDEDGLEVYDSDGGVLYSDSSDTDEEDEGGRRPHKRKRPNIRRTWISPTAEAEWQRQQEIPDPEEPHPDDIVSEDSDYPEGGKDACTKD